MFVALFFFWVGGGDLKILLSKPQNNTKKKTPTEAVTKQQLHKTHITPEQ